ncbi:2-phosphosulfolactate phosphatase [Streptomyces sp. SAS_267]|jgi:2-phosphosulfolactate phosphatase|uniref:2-phosphosulfolactate phosphatase n=1 Tax=unclassified Streptomyces TaxID=2593676 RepID=UPI0036F74C4B
MIDWATQSGSGIRFEWGQTGARCLAAEAACLVVVDVLSFTTAVSVAVQAGSKVLPFWLPPATATAAERAGAEMAAAIYARQSGARLAVARSAVPLDAPWFLSPAQLRKAPFTARLVLPSPVCSIVTAAARPGVPVVAACLRNITAVGSWITSHGYGTPERPVAVIAAGEQWPDGSLRPALEDLLGAGALISDLHAQGAGPLSAEAAAARTCSECTADIPHAITISVSGRELALAGSTEDVAIAVEEDTCPVVPVLGGDRVFTAAAP